MRVRPLLWAGIGLAAMGAAVLKPGMPLLVWNGSGSAPVGLYRSVSGVAERGDLVLVRLPARAQMLAESRDYLPRDVGLIKQIAAVEGTHVCTDGEQMFVDGEVAARRLQRDSRGRFLPDWRGCRELSAGEILLLQPHPHSFDGRYLGPLPRDLIVTRLAFLGPAGAPSDPN